MSDFKQRLKLELNQDVPFTADVRARIEQPNPRKQKRLFKPFFAVLGIAALCMMLLFMQFEQERPFLYSADDAPVGYYELLTELKNNEVQLPLVSEARPNQQVIDDANTIFNGVFIQFNGHHVIVEEARKLERGDYVLFEEQDGKRYVRQLLAQDKERYAIANGNVFINGEQLIMPGIVHGKPFEQMLLAERTHIYFASLGQTMLEEQEPTALRDGELLIQAKNALYKQVDIIEEKQVIGKVVAVKKVKPTFMLTGEAAAIYEQFKRDYETAPLQALDAVTMLRMRIQAEMEGEWTAAYKLSPAFTQLYNVTQEQFMKIHTMLNPHATAEEIESVYGAQYNGLEQGTEIISGTKKRVDVYYTSHKKDELNERMFTMIQNADGFWEIQRPY